MEEADELCSRLAIIDRGKLLALGPPAELKRSTGADTIVTVSATGDLDALAKVLEAEVPGAGDLDPGRRHRAPRCAGPTGRAARRLQTSPSATASTCPTSRSTSPPLENRLHQPHREGPPRMSAVTVPTPITLARGSQADGGGARRVPFVVAARPRRVAQDAQGVHPRTILQPFLLVFVFTYVFPKIGQGVGGGGEAASGFSTLLVAGVVGIAILMQGIQSVSLPMVQEFGYTREIEDRVLAPMPVELVAIQKAIWGRAERAVLGAARVPDRRHRAGHSRESEHQLAGAADADPARLLHVRRVGPDLRHPLRPRTVPLLFGIIVIPLTFLGCVYYSWSSLEAIRW